MNTINTDRPNVSWRPFLKTTMESLIAFYIATFCVAMYFTHRAGNWVPAFILLIILYLFVIITCAQRVLRKLSLATIMLIIPIAPLIALIIVVTMIPLLQWFA